MVVCDFVLDADASAQDCRWPSSRPWFSPATPRTHSRNYGFENHNCPETDWGGYGVSS